MCKEAFKNQLMYSNTIVIEPKIHGPICYSIQTIGLQFDIWREHVSMDMQMKIKQTRL